MAKIIKLNGIKVEQIDNDQSVFTSSKKLNFKEYIQKVFPEKSVRKRTQFGPVQNFAKYLGLRAGYILYRLCVSANLLDIFGVFLALFGFYLLSLVTVGYKYLPVLGICFLFIHVWIDFIDGTIANATDKKSEIGYHLDGLGNEIDRFTLLVLCGYFTDSMFFILANTIAAYILFVFKLPVVELFPDTRLLKIIKKIYTSKLSFLGMRFLLGIFLLFLIVYILFGLPIKIIGLIMSCFYCCMAVIFLIICLPYYPSQK